MSRIGQVLRGKWKLERVLGVGGMGAVYAATHRNGLRGAVKILHPDVALEQDARSRFLREGYVANRVARGAVKVLDDDTTEDGTVFLVMELLDGTNVDAIASKRTGERLDAREVIDIGLQLLDTLILAHAAGIVHRDIKPENLFMMTTGELRVLDFGIARLRELSGAANVRATDTGSAMGTPAFMPPEQALAHWDEVGPHSDLYSVGATLFTLLAGDLPHVARSTPELIVAVATKPARPLASLVPDVSPALAAVIDRALLRVPRERWPDAKTMRCELARVADTFDPEDAPTIEHPVIALERVTALSRVTTSPVSSERTTGRISTPPKRRFVAMKFGLAALPFLVVGLVVARWISTPTSVAHENNGWSSSQVVSGSDSATTRSDDVPVEHNWEPPSVIAAPVELVAPLPSNVETRALRVVPRRSEHLDIAASPTATASARKSASAVPASPNLPLDLSNPN